MARIFDIIDPEEEKQRRRRRWVLLCSAVIGLGIFAYPQIHMYAPKWSALTASRKLGFYLQSLKTKAILSKKAIEVKFTGARGIEVYEVTSCGPRAGRVKVTERSLDEFAAGVEFMPAAWVHEAIESNEAVLTRFCYDPLFGSSVFADGFVHGAVFIAQASLSQLQKTESVVRLLFLGMNGDIELE